MSHHEETPISGQARSVCQETIARHQEKIRLQREDDIRDYIEKENIFFAISQGWFFPTSEKIGKETDEEFEARCQKKWNEIHILANSEDVKTQDQAYQAWKVIEEAKRFAIPEEIAEAARKGKKS